MTGRVRLPALLLAALLGTPHLLPGQWTSPRGGWFLSNTVSSGRFPDRFSPQRGARANALHKKDWGLYAVYGLREGFSVGLGQGYASLRDERDGTTATSEGFGATGVFAVARLAQGRHGIVSLQVRGDVPLLFDRATRPALGPLKPEGELRVLYGNGFGVAGTRGFVSLSAAAAPIREGNDEFRYDVTAGVDAGPRALVMAQSFNVTAPRDGDRSGYSAHKLGLSLLWRVRPGVGVLGGYYAGVAGRNTARERTLSVGLWLSHEPPAAVLPSSRP